MPNPTYTIGTLVEKPTLITPDNLEMDIVKLVDSRMLVQANSGGGKSYLLRKLAEQACQHVQTIVIDYEGEFTSLREKFDFILVGEGGEVPADPKNASMLARRLMELNASAIIDLSGLDLPGRRQLVKNFFTAIVAMPKSLWHPAIFIIDEAHQFCPERSAGEAESTKAIVDFMSLGRKRTFCGVLATQRLSKLHKDASAECNNIFIGRTVQDLDQKRAASVMGFAKQETIGLKDLAPGEWYAYGPALLFNGIARFRGSKSETTHPVSGKRHTLKAPAASGVIKSFVPELADLARKEGDDPLTLEEANQTIAQLRRALQSSKAAAPDPDAIQRAVAKALADVSHKFDIALASRDQEWIEKISMRWADLDFRIKSELGECLRDLVTPAPAKDRNPVFASDAPKLSTLPVPNQRAVLPTRRTPTVTRSRDVGSSAGVKLPIGEQKVLTACAQYQDGLRREQLTVLTQYKRSSRDAYIQRLKEKGLVEQQGDRILATDAGIDALGSSFTPLPTGEALRDHWFGILPQGERAILEVLVANYPKAVDREKLSEATGYQRSSRDAYLQRLSAKELVDIVGRGEVKASDNLFD